VFKGKNTKSSGGPPISRPSGKVREVDKEHGGKVFERRKGRAGSNGRRNGFEGANTSEEGIDGEIENPVR